MGEFEEAATLGGAAEVLLDVGPVCDAKPAVLRIARGDVSVEYVRADVFDAAVAGLDARGGAEGALRDLLSEVEDERRLHASDDRADGGVRDA